jgi:chromosome segregation ATPase
MPLDEKYTNKQTNKLLVWKAQTETTGQSGFARLDYQSSPRTADQTNSLRTIASSGFSLLRTKLKEVDALNEKNIRLQTAYDEAIDRFAKREAKQAGEKDQQKQVLESYKKKVDDAAEVNKQLKEELAKQRAALADKATQVNEQEARIRGMITQSKKQEAEMQSLKIAEGERDGLRDQLATMTKRNEATASKLADAQQSLDFVRTHAVHLTPIQEDREGVYVHPQPQRHRVLPCCPAQADALYPACILTCRDCLAAVG